MNTDFEDRLHADLVRFTRDIRVPPGMALRAYRGNRKRRRRLCLAVASGAATAVAASAVVIAGVSGAFGPAPGPATQNTQTTAYVLRHVENALVPANVDNLVSFSRQTFRAGATWQPVVGGLDGGMTSGGASSPWLTAFMLRWTYQGNQKASAYSPSGQHVFDVGISAENGSATQTVVIYGNRTWWTVSVSPSGPASGPGSGSGSGSRSRSGSGSPGCTTGAIALNSGPGSGWPAFIRSQLSCGAYRVVGHQVVDRIDAIKITGQGRPLTLFVDPATYLPIRLDIGPGRIDFTWLSPTAANLAQLKLSVPAGFQQVPPPQP